MMTHLKTSFLAGITLTLGFATLGLSQEENSVKCIAGDMDCIQEAMRLMKTVEIVKSSGHNTDILCGPVDIECMKKADERGWLVGIKEQ